MGLAERFTSKVKDGKVCLSLVLLLLQDLQYAFLLLFSPYLVTWAMNFPSLVLCD